MYSGHGSQFLSPTSSLKLTYGWVYGFVRRFQLSLRTITHQLQSRVVGQYANTNGLTSLPAASLTTESKVPSFRKFLSDLHRPCHNFSVDDDWYNMDQTPIWLNTLHLQGRTVDQRGKAKVCARVEAGANLREKVTVILACSRRGNKLPPALVVHSQSKRFQRARIQLVNGVIIFHNPGTSMANSDIMSRWVRIMMDQQESKESAHDNGDVQPYNKRRLLILDSFRGHLTDEVASACKDVGVVRAVIPGGLTSQLQPLDLTVNRSFKSKLRTIYREFWENGQNLFKGDRDVPTRGTRFSTKTAWRLHILTKAVCLAWNQIPRSVVCNGFKTMVRNMRK